MFILGLSGGEFPPQKKKKSEIPQTLKMYYAKIVFLSISRVIFSPASGALPPDPHRGSAPDLPLLFKLHDIWLVDCQENHYNCCHQMSDFKAKMHQIRFRLGLRPRPRWGSLQRSPRPSSWIYGAYF